MKILVINGPNMNFLGIREPEVYGTADYDQLRQMIMKKASQENVLVELYQSNHEGFIIDKLQECFGDNTDGIVINPGALAHYSYAIHDALKSLKEIPKVEVHISDIMNRAEEWRKISVTAPACDEVIYGHGMEGYLEAIDYLVKKTVEK